MNYGTWVARGCGWGQRVLQGGHVILTAAFVFSAPCSTNFTTPEGHIEVPAQPDAWSYPGLDCTYTISVYMGYGVEIQVSASPSTCSSTMSQNDIEYTGFIQARVRREQKKGQNSYGGADLIVSQ